MITRLIDRMIITVLFTEQKMVTVCITSLLVKLLTVQLTALGVNLTETIGRTCSITSHTNPS